jgi:RNA polymerase sigma-70 factor (ECF subfamily)
MTFSNWPQPSSDCLRRARAGDPHAASRILGIYLGQLIKVVGARLDARLAARFDPSDVVHDVMATAVNLLSKWLADEKAVYACLYQLVRDRLAIIRRDHIAAQKRSVEREAANFAELSDESVLQLCQQLVARGETPSKAAIRRESQQRVRQALGQLRDIDREVLVMRILEGTPAKEVAEILGITEDAVNMRQLRALKRVRALLE